VTRESLAGFLEAIGEKVVDGEALTAPPTFMKMLEGKDSSSRRIMEALGADLRRILHAEQAFEYFSPICEGQRLTVRRRVADITSRKGGRMEFVLIESDFVEASSQTLMGRSIQTVLVRYPDGRES